MAYKILKLNLTPHQIKRVRQWVKRELKADPIRFNNFYALTADLRIGRNLPKTNKLVVVLLDSQQHEIFSEAIRRADPATKKGGAR
jgi:hypothetical protein